jgi:hypothetical protein
MRKPILYGILAFALLGMAFSAGRAVTNRPDQPRAEAMKGPMILWEPEDLKAWSEPGVAQVQHIVQQLQEDIDKIPPAGPLTKDMIARIAAIYGANGIMTGHDGETYRGSREIAMYLSYLTLCRKVTDFRIQIKLVYAKEFTAVAKNLRGSDDDIIHSLYFILSTSYKIDGVPVDPLSSTECPHVRICECDRSR